MTETVYFEDGDVKVTEARFVSGNETFAMKNITSIKTKTNAPSRKAPGLGMLIGLVLLISNYAESAAQVNRSAQSGGAAGVVLGLMLVGGCAYWMAKLKPIYEIVLQTSGVEKAALHTRQPEYLRQILEAMNKAMAHRQ